MKFATLIGRPSQPTEDSEERVLREARVAAARSNPYWTEFDETMLVERPPEYLVHAESDCLYTRYRGSIFARGQAHPSFQERVELAFVVDRDGHLLFLEPVPGAATWSEIVARKARRGVPT